MKDALLFKATLLRTLREFLHDRGFVELYTPVVRRVDDGFRPRPEVSLNGSRYLREAVGPALRHNLRHFPKVYELGPCFRTDPPSLTHSPEFLMLDLYQRDEDFTSLITLAEDLLHTCYPGDVTQISLIDEFRAHYDLDITTADEEKVRTTLVKALRIPQYETTYAAVEAFVKRHIEPITADRCVILRDFPLETEVCARLRSDATSVLNRFEVLINGLEVIHGYEDEPDSHLFEQRARSSYFYNEEQERIHTDIRAGVLPAASSGMGIGIERLCMAATNSPDISSFLPSVDF